MTEQEWHNKGTGCFSPMSTCCLSFWCPCVMFGKVHHRLSKNDPQMQGYSSCNWACCGYCLAMHFGVQWIFQGMQRSDLRQNFNLKGNFCGDLLCACCCVCCDLAQQEKEVTYRNEEKQGLMGGYIAQQPLADNGMQYAAPPPVVAPPPAAKHGY